MRLALLLVISICISPSTAEAGAASSAAQTVFRKLTGEASRIAVTQSAKQLGVHAAAKAAKEAAEAAARRGSAVAARHFGKTYGRSPGFADDLAKTLTTISPRNQRRLLTLAPELEQTGKAAGVVARMASGSGDEIVETLWRHRGKLAAAAAVTSLAVHGDAVVAAAGEYIATPVIEGTIQHVVAPASRLVFGGLAIAALIALVVLLIAGFPAHCIRRLKDKFARRGDAARRNA